MKLRDRHGWAAAAAAAGVAWLGCLCVAAVCLLAPKLQYPAFARGADPVEIFTAVVVTALGLFRVPIHIGGLTISALPLGAVAALAVAIGSAAAGAPQRPLHTRTALLTAVRIAAVFAAIGVLLALVFRIPGRDAVSASPGWALVLTFVWSLGFAALALRLPPRWWMPSFGARLSSVWQGQPPAPTGVWGGVVMTVNACVLAAVALLGWIIIELIRGEPLPGFGLADAAAALLFLIAFLPNILVAIVALSLGAPILRGAQVGLGGQTIGRLREVSLLHWPDEAATVYALVLIPIVSCAVGGWLLARGQPHGTTEWRPLFTSAVTFAGSLAVLAWIGDARIGAGLVENRGFARIAVQPLPTFGWGMLWALVFGWLGWELALRRSKG